MKQADVIFSAEHGEITEEHRARLCRENVARLQAFKANPPPALPQKDYRPLPLAAPLPGLPVKPKRWSERKTAKFAAKVEAKYGRKFEPIRMTAIAPPPPNSGSLVD